MKKFTFVIIGVALFLFCPIAHAANKVVVIPLNSTQQPEGSPDKVWGQGRPGITTVTHDDPDGYCTTGEGINFALSTHFATWGNAASVCPKDAWVCTNDEIGSTKCDVTSLTTYNYKKCDVTNALVPGSPVLLDSLWGWLADAYGDGPLFTRFKKSDEEVVWPADYCNAMRVWCCWE